MTDPQTAWIRRFRPAPDASVRLACLPHAGGSATFFFPLAPALGPDVDMLAVQYPGRQERRMEPPIENIPEMARRLARELVPWTDRGLALFGHSLGAVIAYETARILTAAGRPPVALFASGRRAPSWDRPELTHLQSDAELLAAVRKMGGTDPRVLADEELVRMVLPVIRADYRAIDGYRHADGPMLDCPVTVLTGADDPQVSAEEAEAWRKHTTGAFEVVTFPGEHFFLIDHHAAVTTAIVDRLVRS
jgi:surfactin synthase thioesterase subunit